MSRLAAVAAVLVLAVTGCGSNDKQAPAPTVDVAACKAAMKAQFAQATTNPDALEGTRPAACQGVDDATLQRLAGEVIGEATEG